MELVGVRIEWPSQTPIVFLKETTGERYLPIWIGRYEAEAISDGMRGVEHERPWAHELMRDLLTGLRVKVERIVITELREQSAGGTFFAEIVMNAGGKTVSVSSRPSDAIALAVRLSAPIFAAEGVLEQAAIPPEGQGREGGQNVEQEMEQFRSFLEQVNPEDFQP